MKIRTKTDLGTMPVGEFFSTLGVVFALLFVVMLAIAGIARMITMISAFPLALVLGIVLTIGVGVSTFDGVEYEQE